MPKKTTRYAFVADVHVANHRRFGGPLLAGVNRRAQHIFAALEHAYREADQMGATNMMVLGDLFDSAKPEPQLIAGVQRVMKLAETTWGIATTVLLGNHEMASSEVGDNALAPLWEQSEIVDRPRILRHEDLHVWAAPFRPGPAKKWLPEVLSELEREDSAAAGGTSPASSAGVRVLALHLGIEDEGTPPFMRGAPDSIRLPLLRELCRDFEITAAVAGNWHEEHDWPGRPGVFQVGSLAPTGFDNPGVKYGRVLAIDKEGLSARRVGGPRFVRTERWEDVVAATCFMPRCQVYASLSVPPADLPKTRKLLAEAIAEGRVVDGEVVPSGEAASTAARQAAREARSSTTLEEAVAAYVEKMPLPDEVERPAVARRSRGFLGI